jgi:hypothetical protein
MFVFGYFVCERSVEYMSNSARDAIIQPGAPLAPSLLSLAKRIRQLRSAAANAELRCVQMCPVSREFRLSADVFV